MYSINPLLASLPYLKPPRVVLSPKVSPKSSIRPTVLFIAFLDASYGATAKVSNAQLFFNAGGKSDNTPPSVGLSIVLAY